MVDDLAGVEVFPARAGVSPAAVLRERAATGLPRASGGESGAAINYGNIRQSSPRERG
ncbi:hypothetical protein [Actinopolyspora erythraea]|uniref:hypothetical protein n=1 Tax=Actinopolyspora erythraea TaxID=414996 RepID=UPI000A3F442C